MGQQPPVKNVQLAVLPYSKSILGVDTCERALLYTSNKRGISMNFVRFIGQIAADKCRDNYLNGQFFIILCSKISI
jgi:hypothetical protein